MVGIVMKALILIVLMICSGAAFAQPKQQQTGINLAATSIYFGVGDRHYDRYDRRYDRRYHRHERRYDRHHRSQRCYVKRCWNRHGYVKCRYYQTSCRYR
jgi:hypothetical protein